MTEHASLDYYIEVEKIQPLARKDHFAAKPILSKRVDISEFSTEPPLKEVWGETEADARARARKAMVEWASEVGISLTELP